MTFPPKRYPSYKFVTSVKEVVVMRKSRFSEAQIIGILKQALAILPSSLANSKMESLCLASFSSASIGGLLSVSFPKICPMRSLIIQFICKRYYILAG